jgi:hypothetical protein
MGARPATPLPVKRQLRQEARFGCCSCGHPILVYHHIVRWEHEQHFRPEDMMVLCPNHAREADSGAMREDEQRHAKQQPVNLRTGHAKGFLKVNQQPLALNMGPLVLHEGLFIEAWDQEVLEFHSDDGWLGISLTLLDEDGTLLVRIENNEWVTGDPELWDLEAAPQRLVIRKRHGDVRLSLDASAEPLRLRGNTFVGPHPVPIHFGDDGLVIGTVRKLRIPHDLAIVGASIRVDEQTISFGGTQGHTARFVFADSEQRLYQRASQVYDYWRDNQELPADLKAEITEAGSGRTSIEIIEC